MDERLKPEPFGGVAQSQRNAVIEECAQTAMSSVPLFGMGLVDASEFCDFVQDTIVADIRGMKSSPVSSTDRGCGDPSCKDPDCSYGTGQARPM